MDLQAFDPHAIDAFRIRKEARQLRIYGEAANYDHRRRARAIREAQHQIVADCMDRGEKSDLQIAQLNIAFVALSKSSDDIVARNWLKADYEDGDSHRQADGWWPRLETRCVTENP